MPNSIMEEETESSVQSPVLTPTSIMSEANNHFAAPLKMKLPEEVESQSPCTTECDSVLSTLELDLEAVTPPEEMIALQFDDQLERLRFLEYDFDLKKDGFDGFSKLYETRKFSDVDLIIGPDRVPFKAHRGVLSEKSKFFDDLFSSEENQQINQVILPGCHHEVLESIICYMYTGEMNLRPHPGYVARLYVEAKFLGMPELQDCALSFFQDVMLVEHSSHTLPASCIISMIRGLAYLGTTEKIWSSFSSLLDLVAGSKDFDCWMEDEQFIRMLDQMGVLARVLLQKKGRTKQTKERNSKLSDEEVIAEEAVAEAALGIAPPQSGEQADKGSEKTDNSIKIKGQLEPHGFWEDFKTHWGQVRKEMQKRT